ncbi:hypothetical protein CGRA01v4_03917 [Colletotrichum graminicola]|nr:hypothetical protein CGRA01v4_03917 [Colletotrichum graminicola]
MGRNQKIVDAERQLQQKSGREKSLDRIYFGSPSWFVGTGIQETEPTRAKRRSGRTCEETDQGGASVSVSREPSDKERVQEYSLYSLALQLDRQLFSPD